MRGWPVVLVAAMMMAVMSWWNRSLQTPVAPDGILSLEFAWRAERALAIVTSWRDAGVHDTALRLQTLDLVFPLVYAQAAAVLMAAAASWRGAVGSVGAWLALPYLAALFDTIENFVLLIALNGPVATWGMRIGSSAAALKFGLLVGVVVFIGWRAAPRRA